MNIYPLLRKSYPDVADFICEATAHYMLVIANTNSCEITKIEVKNVFRTAWHMKIYCKTTDGQLNKWNDHDTWHIYRIARNKVLCADIGSTPKTQIMLHKLFRIFIKHRILVVPWFE